MSYDYQKANAAAFFAVSELARLLRDAINDEQEFKVEIRRVCGNDSEQEKKSTEVSIRICG